MYWDTGRRFHRHDSSCVHGALNHAALATDAGICHQATSLLFLNMCRAFGGATSSAPGGYSGWTETVPAMPAKKSQPQQVCWRLHTGKNHFKVFYGKVLCGAAALTHGACHVPRRCAKSSVMTPLPAATDAAGAQPQDHLQVARRHARWRAAGAHRDSRRGAGRASRRARAWRCRAGSARGALPGGAAPGRG
jgi:hypothetical protein